MIADSPALTFQAGPQQPSGFGAGAPVVVRRVRRAGAHDPLKVLLLHGMSGGTRVWDEFIALADPCCEIWNAALPWRGAGVPGWAAEPARAWIGTAAAAVPGGPDLIVAHSFACNALLAWLDWQGMDTQHAPRGIVLACPLYRTRGAGPRESLGRRLIADLDTVLAEGLRAFGRERIPAERRQAVAERLRESIGPSGWARFLDACLHTQALRGERLRLPVLIVGGEADVVSPSDTRALGRVLPGASVHVLPGRGHFPMAAPGGPFARLANRFLLQFARPSRDGARRMTANPAPAAASALLAESTRIPVRPRYEGSNICTWIGFKHVNYLVEEAVLEHFRRHGSAPGALFEQHGLGLDLVDLDTRILRALHIDDEVEARVTPSAGGAGSALRLKVTLTTGHGETRAAVADVAVALCAGRGGVPLAEPPRELSAFTVPHAPAALDPAALGPAAVDPASVLARLTAGTNSFAWKRRIPYFYCHFNERLQLSGYLRQMEETVDLFLADRGISIRRLLADRGWIPVVPRSHVRILEEASMEEDLFTVYTVEEIFKDLTYTARMDCYVPRAGGLVRTAVGRITHGYAAIEGARDWRLVAFDDRVLRALRGEPAGVATHG